MRMDLVAEDGGGGHKEESKELLPAGEGMEPVEVCRLSNSIMSHSQMLVKFEYTLPAKF